MPSCSFARAPFAGANEGADYFFFFAGLLGLDGFAALTAFAGLDFAEPAAFGAAVFDGGEAATL